MNESWWDRRKFLAAGALGAAGLAAGCSVFDRRGFDSGLGELYGKFSQEPLPRLKQGPALAIDEQWVKSLIADFVKDSPANSLEKEFAGERIYQEPLIGFARGDDALFEQYKTIIGPFHHTPEEVVMWAAHQQMVKAPLAAEVGVISMILPFNAPIVESNAREKRWCSPRWAQARLLGGLFVKEVEMMVIAALAERGILAAAPELMPDFTSQNHRESVGWASTWSQRHIAFAAGLGSFGMSDLFISEKGTAHRCGSVVAAWPLKPDRELPPHYRHHCLYHQLGECLVCAQRCPAGAITEQGHDKEKCRKNVVSSWSRNNARYNINIYGCGLCSSGAPCSQESPIG